MLTHLKLLTRLPDNHVLLPRQLTLNALQFLVLTTLGLAGSVSGMACKLRVEYPGAVYPVMNRGERRETIFKDDQDRERMIAEALKRRKWRAGGLAARAKGELSKVAIAAPVRAETVVTVKWIAERLGMGTAGYLNNRLYRWRQGSLR